MNSVARNAHREAIARYNGGAIKHGNPFYYTGHFNRMRNTVLKLTDINIEFTESATGQKWCWPIIGLNDVGFVARSIVFGNISVSFDECTFKKPENP